MKMNPSQQTLSDVKRNDMTRSSSVIAGRGRSSLDVDLALLENEVLTDHPLPDVLDIVYDRLEVRSSIVRTRNEDVVGFTGSRRGI